jgi:hypothetical protein
MALSKNILKAIKIGIRAATFCTESQKPEEDMKSVTQIN